MGIDPGIAGAIALYVTDSHAVTEPDGIVDLPVMGEEAKRELNYVALRNILYHMRPDMVVLERAMAMPAIPDANGVRRQMGAASSFKFGGSWYAIKAVIACLELPMHPPVMPAAWKRHFGLPGGEAGKEPSRQMVIQKYPILAPSLLRKKDHQRAEAFLIAAWYAETGGRSVRVPRPKKKQVDVAEIMFDEEEIPE